MDTLEHVRLGLALSLVVSNVFVWRGVYLENEKFPQETKDHGWKMLVLALAAEAALAFLLVCVDTTVGIGQKREIATARLETERIKERLAWREVSPSQSKLIISALSAAPPQIVLWHLSTDPEATNLYFQLKDAFLAAHVDSSDDRALINSGTPRYGVLLAGRKSDVDRMRDALQAGDVEVTGTTVADETLNVWIGTKPRPKEP